MIHLSSQQCLPSFGSAIGSTEEIFDQISNPISPSGLSLEHRLYSNFNSHETFADEDNSVKTTFDSADKSLSISVETYDFPYDNRISSSSISEAEPESTDGYSQKNLIWIDQSNDVLLNGPEPGFSSSNPNSPLEDVKDVRRRLEKRKRRGSAKSHIREDCKTKRVRNTMAARRYRQRRQEEVEILDKKVEELEDELSKTKLDTKWWQMEAQRWRELAEKRTGN